MKASKMFLLCVALLVIGIMPVDAQSSKMKARMTQIRNDYAKAVKLAEAGLMGPRKNSQVFVANVSDPLGTTEKKTEFIFDNSEMSKELEIYPCKLVMVRQTEGRIYTEYLYDDEGKVAFYFLRTPAEDKGQTREYRAYFDTDTTGWVIDRYIDNKTKKVINEYPSELEYDMEIFQLRQAADLFSAFQLLNRIYE